MKHGGDIYAPITPERFISGPYPPIYYWLTAWLLPESLPDFSSPSTVSSIFTPGRTLSLIAALVVAALVPLLVIFDGRYPFGGPYPFESHYHRRRTLWLAATGGLVGSLTFVTLPQTVVWATRFRGDILMLSFPVAGLVCVAAGGQKALGRRKKAEDGSHLRVSSVLSAQYAVLFLGALFFALAFYTKQTAIAGPLAAAAYLLVRDWRLGLKWCGVMLAAVGVPFIFL